MAGELILLVADNEKNRKLARDVLVHQGYRVAEAESAEDGLALVARERPRLILMDIHLPGMDGIEALRRLRADEATRAIPVIAVTASAMTHDRQTIMAAGHRRAPGAGPTSIPTTLPPPSVRSRHFPSLADASAPRGPGRSQLVQVQTPGPDYLQR